MFTPGLSCMCANGQIKVTPPPAAAIYGTLEGVVLFALPMTLYHFFDSLFTLNNADMY